MNRCHIIYVYQAMQQDEFTAAYASYRRKSGKNENQRGLACASLSLVTAARLSARRARLPILGCAAELRVELARLGREPVESVNRARQLEAARPWASVGRMGKGWAPWASTAGPPLTVGERLPRATELLLDLGLEGDALPMGNWAGLLVPSLATERELEELVPGLLGVMALSL